MHNNNEKNKSSMGWMILLCVLPLLALLFMGRGLSLSGYLWPILIGACVVAHFWMMFKGHGKHDDGETQPDNKDDHAEHKHSGCCH